MPFVESLTNSFAVYAQGNPNCGFLRKTRETGFELTGDKVDCAGSRSFSRETENPRSEHVTLFPSTGSLVSRYDVIDVDCSTIQENLSACEHSFLIPEERGSIPIISGLETLVFRTSNLGK
jgi:hypothetical protein